MAERRAGLTPQIVMGVLIAFLGLLLFLENLNLLDMHFFWRYWPFALLVWGMSKALQSEDGGGRINGFLFLVIGVVLLLRNLDVLDFKLLALWPLALVILGANILWQAVSGRRIRRKFDPSDSTVLDANAVLNSLDRRIIAQDFHGGSATALLGSCDVDLTRASIAGQEATIQTFAFWGGLEFRVPDDWEVVLKGTSILGSFGDRTSHIKLGGGVPSKRLIVQGTVIMGGVEIRN